MRHFVLGLLLVSASVPALAETSRWGVFDEIANREWTTDKEPRPRVTKFRWIEEGRVLEARHGFASRLQFGEAKFADTVQRFVLDPKTGKIDVTYSYEDGRPPLKAVIEIQDDGTAIETFTDKNGAEKRNIYRSPSLSNNAIERQEKKDGSWVSLGTTRKSGLTQFEIAENKRRAEEARQRAIAQENRRIAAERERERIEMARREAEDRAYAQQQAQMQQQPMYNMLDALNAIGNSMRQSSSGGGSYGGSSYGGSSYGGSSSGGAIIVKDTSAEDARWRAEDQARWDAQAERDRQQAERDRIATEEHARQVEAERANAVDCWGRPVSASSGSSSSSSSSGGGSAVCPQ